MNSKVIGAMLILGPILTMGVWIVLDVDTSDLTPSDQMATILAQSKKVELGSILNVFGVMSMFTGLYFLTRTLKSDNTVSNTVSEIGGLLLLLSVPVWVVLVGSDISAIEIAKKHGNEFKTPINKPSRRDNFTKSMKTGTKRLLRDAAIKKTLPPTARAGNQ